ncbi:hypothetical protein QJS04_geneDACA014363 [Acorus gramineus]|uniref:Urease accessory protein D n=1 Tax=Acorus gramineus TaxID=55184 RepID=A0AAV8ZZ09_ACOGR|nr:hypothetical protein QJS04_geneDACA014363 [Acorus gramineus]
METGLIEVEKVRGKSTVTRCFSKYPLKFIVPSKVGSSDTDAIWVYSLSYGGGIVSGDSISCGVTVGDGCTVALTTQASTKVYKSLDAKHSEQVLEARIGKESLLAVIPDPVTCYAAAKYCQKQVFHVVSESNLVLVDWLTSGRHKSGEKWDFDIYKSANHIILEGDQPLFLDSLLLEQGCSMSISQRMHDYHVIAMVVLLGPKLKHLQSQLQEEVKETMSKNLRMPVSSSGHYTRNGPTYNPQRPALIASCSPFGPMGAGLVVRIAAVTTESVYNFLRHHLASLEPLLGVPPYT